MATRNTNGKPTGQATLLRRAAVHDRQKLERERDEARAETARVKREAADAKHKDDVETIALLNAQAVGATRTEAVRVAHIVEAERRRFVSEGTAGTFGALRATREALARVRGTLPPSRDSNPLDAALPPPADGVRAAHNETADDKARRDAARQSAYERGREAVEREKREKEQYRETLRKYGLADPSQGSSGRNPGGLGY